MSAAQRYTDPDALLYASRALLAGHGYQGASKVAGLPEALIRREFPHRVEAPAPAPPLVVYTKPRAPRLATPAEVIRSLGKMPKRDVVAVYEHCMVALGMLRPRHVFAADILGVVAVHFQLTRADLTGQSRYRVVARPRQIACFLIREYRPDMSLPAIGRIMGGRDHTTILHGIRTITAMLETDPEIGEAVERIRAAINLKIAADGVAG